MLYGLYKILKDFFSFFYSPVKKGFDYFKGEYDRSKLDNVSYAKFKIRQKRIDRVNDEY